MTFKKSMISIAAASVIAAGLTGCGSSGSTAAVVAAAEDTTTSTAPSSFTAVDGRIMNAVATAYYVDENNATQALTLDANKTGTNVVTSVASKGSYAYTIPTDSNVTADMIRYVEINATNANITADGISYPATFIDVDGSGDYNATLDQAFTGSLYAPKGAEYVTPVSTLVYNLVGNAAMTADDFNATLLTNKLELIAAKLNLSTDDILNVDPAEKPEYGFVNAMLGVDVANLATVATALENLDANSTNFGAVISALASNGSAATKTLFAAVKTQLDAGTLTTDDLASLNFDNTRANDGIPVLAEASTTSIGDINSTQIDGVDVTELISTGAKVQAGALTFQFTAGESTDANASSTVDLYLSLTGDKATVASTEDTTNKLVIKVSNIEVKRVDGTTVIDNNVSTSNTSFEWYTSRTDSAKNYVSRTDLNDSIIDLDTVFSADNTINLGTLVTNVEGNLSSTTENNNSDTFLDGITAMTAIIVDSDKALQFVDASDNAKLMPTATVAGTGNAIVAQGISVINNSVTDSRLTAVTGANIAPNPAYVVETIAADTNRTRSATNDLNASHGDLLDVNVTAANAINSYESNTTFTWTLGTGLKDINLTEVARVVDLNGTANVTGAIEANSTTDAFTTFTGTFTDEFGESNSTVVDIFVNAAPKASSLTYAPTGEYNGTTPTTAITITNIYDMNNTIPSFIDVNTSNTDANISDCNVTDGVLLIKFADDANMTDVNLTIFDPVTTDLNVTVNVKGGSVN